MIGLGALLQLQGKMFFLSAFLSDRLPKSSFNNRQWMQYAHSCYSPYFPVFSFFWIWICICICLCITVDPERDGAAALRLFQLLPNICLCPTALPILHTGGPDVRYCVFVLSTAHPLQIRRGERAKPRALSCRVRCSRGLSCPQGRGSGRRGSN